MRAGLVREPGDWPWSSAKAHISGRDDKLVKVTPLMETAGGGWNDFLGEGLQEEIVRRRKHEETSRPLGSDGFIETIENMLGSTIKPRKAGRKPKKR